MQIFSVCNKLNISLNMSQKWKEGNLSLMLMINISSWPSEPALFLQCGRTCALMATDVRGIISVTQRHDKKKKQVLRSFVYAYSGSNVAPGVLDYCCGAISFVALLSHRFAVMK